jgi:hypothetical protein
MDRLLKPDVPQRFSTLFDMVEAKRGSAAEAAWWGPVIGADEASPPPPSPGLVAGAELVSDEKLVPLTVCEE